MIAWSCCADAALGIRDGADGSTARTFPEAVGGEGCACPDGASSAPPAFPLLIQRYHGTCTGEEGMHNPLRLQLLDDVVHAIQITRPLVEAIGRHDRDLHN